jgi:hypothetical protein
VRPIEYLPEAAFDSVAWRKASSSEPQQGCVAFAVVGDVIGIRDAEVPDGPILQFTRTEIAAMLDGVKNGEFDDLQ